MRADFPNLIDLLRNADRAFAARFFDGGPDHFPRFLYQYHGPGSKGIEGLLIRSEVWLSDPANFNDPFELKSRVVFEGTPKQKMNALLAAMKGRGVPHANRQSVAEAIYRSGNVEALLQASLDKRAVDFGVCCFATDPRHVLMWSHYAQKHQGVCFQFHGCESAELMCQAFPVRYSDAFATVNWARRETMEKQLGGLFFRKAKRWAYEGEHRIVRNYAAARAVPINPAALRGVILGTRCTVETRGLVTRLCEQRARKGLPRVRVFQAQGAAASYELSIVRASAAR